MLTKRQKAFFYQNEYRLVWNDPNLKEEEYGTFLFNDPSEAKGPIAALKKLFPDYVIWLEDREHNKIEI